MKKKQICVLMLLWCFGYVAVAAGEEQSETDTSFKWSWEKKRKTRPVADSQAAGMKNKLIKGLMEKNRDLSRQIREAEKNNAILVEELETEKSKVREYATAESRRASSDDAAAVERRRANRYEARMLKTLKKNSDLEVENQRLKKALKKRATTVETTKSVARVSPLRDSDLFKDQEREKIQLRNSIRRLIVQLEKRSREKKVLAEKDRQNTAAIDELKKKLDDREKESVLMEERQKELLADAGRVTRMEEEAERLKVEAEERDKVLAENDREIRNLRKRNKRNSCLIDEAERSEAVLRGEKKDLYFNMAVLYTKAGMYEEAEQAFVKLLKLSPGAEDVHYNLGILYDQYLKDKKKAAAHYRKFLKLAPDSDDAMNVRIWLTELEVAM